MYSCAAVCCDCGKPLSRESGLKGSLLTVDKLGTVLSAEVYFTYERHPDTLELPTHEVSLRDDGATPLRALKVYGKNDSSMRLWTS